MVHHALQLSLHKITQAAKWVTTKSRCSEVPPLQDCFQRQPEILWRYRGHDMQKWSSIFMWVQVAPTLNKYLEVEHISNESSKSKLKVQTAQALFCSARQNLIFGTHRFVLKCCSSRNETSPDFAELDSYHLPLHAFAQWRRKWLNYWQRHKTRSFRVEHLNFIRAVWSNWLIGHGKEWGGLGNWAYHVTPVSALWSLT